MPRLIDADVLLSVLKADLAQSISIDTATEDLFLTRIEEAPTAIDTEIERMRNGLDRAEVENACLDALNAIANIRIADLCKQRDKARHDRNRYKRRIEAVQGENAELRAELEQVKKERNAAVGDLHGQVRVGERCEFCVGTRIPGLCEGCGPMDQLKWQWRGLMDKNGRAFRGSEKAMTLNEYQALAQRTSNTTDHRDKIMNGILGLCGETGEVADIIKKWKYQGHELDMNALIDEASDCMWYLAELSCGLGVPLEAIAQHNVDKLRRRYPDGFEASRSRSREG